MDENPDSVPVGCGGINFLVSVLVGGEVSGLGRGIETTPAVVALLSDPPRQPEVDHLQPIRMTENHVIRPQIVMQVTTCVQRCQGSDEMSSRKY